MITAPRKSILLTRPVDRSDVLIHVDGRSVPAQQLQEVRTFLGDWKIRAQAVSGTGRSAVYVGAAALLVEIPSQERDEEHRLEPVACWVRAPVDELMVMAEVHDFARQAGRSLDEAEAWRALAQGVRAQRRFRRRETVPFSNAVRRLLAALSRLLSRQSQRPA